MQNVSSTRWRSGKNLRNETTALSLLVRRQDFTADVWNLWSFLKSRVKGGNMNMRVVWTWFFYLWYLFSPTVYIVFMLVAHCWRRVWCAAHIKKIADNLFLYHGQPSVVLFLWTLLLILRLHLTLLILHVVTNGTLSWSIQLNNLSSYAIQQKWRQLVLHYQRSSEFVEYY